MSNSFWYILLALIGIMLFAVILYKKKDAKLIVHLFFLAGIVYLFELIIMKFFQSYEFKPNIIKNEYKDNILGAIISDFFVVPSASIVIAVYQLGFKYMVIFSVLIMGIEEWFKKINIYEHYWWKTIYTGLALPVHFWISKKVWQYIRNQNINRLKRFFILYFSHISLHSTLFFITFAFFNSYELKIGWFSNPIRDHMVFGMVFRFLFYSWAAALITVNRDKPIIYGLGYFGMMLINFILINAGIFKISNHFPGIILLILDVLVLVILILFDRILLGKKAISKL